MQTRSRLHAILPTLAAAALSCGALLGPGAAAADDPTGSMDPRRGAVHFGFDEDVMAREAEIKIAWLIAAEAGPMDRVEIEGYADSTGPERYNTDLSLRRARAVRRLPRRGARHRALGAVGRGLRRGLSGGAEHDGRGSRGEPPGRVQAPGPGAGERRFVDTASW